jgi:hypothetical protein
MRAMLASFVLLGVAAGPGWGSCVASTQRSPTAWGQANHAIFDLTSSLNSDLWRTGYVRSTSLVRNFTVCSSSGPGFHSSGTTFDKMFKVNNEPFSLIGG